MSLIERAVSRLAGVTPANDREAKDQLAPQVMPPNEKSASGNGLSKSDFRRS
jgi:hypothetical protein